MAHQQNNPAQQTIPLLYQITNRQAFLHKAEPSQSVIHSQLEAIRRATAAGCQLIQIREKDLPAQTLLEFTRQAIAIARPLGAKTLVNDRLDVAIAANADGVHLRVTSLPVAEVRWVTERLRLPNFLIGASTHSLAEAEAAERGGADFIVCGPVFDTPSKREFGEPLGLKRFAEVCRVVSIPVLALGGINLSNFRQPLNCGAAGIAAISLFNDAENLPELFADLSQTPAGY
ncbi:MAG: thiamine phosphate synthase [Blastocatellia bacterium]